MSAPVDVSMPANLDLGQGYSLRITALDPSTGNLVGGVKVGQVVITATNIVGGDLTSGGFFPFALISGPGA